MCVRVLVGSSGNSERRNEGKKRKEKVPKVQRGAKGMLGVPLAGGHTIIQRRQQQLATRVCVRLSHTCARTPNFSWRNFFSGCRRAAGKTPRHQMRARGRFRPLTDSILLPLGGDPAGHGCGEPVPGRRRLVVSAAVPPSRCCCCCCCTHREGGVGSEDTPPAAL